MLRAGLRLHNAFRPAPVNLITLITLHEIHPMIAIDRVQTIENAEYESMTSPRVMTALLGLFAALAAIISAGGIAAVMALTVSRRRREIGIRMALGASSGSIVGM